MDKAIVIGNLCTLAAMGFNAFSSTRKTTKGILWSQNASQVVYAISATVLGGYSASVQNLVSILRNLLAMTKIRSKLAEWTLVILGVVAGIAVNNRGWIGLLPIVGNLQYTLAIFQFKNDERKLKLFFLISLAAFAVFNFTISNYVGAATDSVVVVTTILMLLRKKEREKA